MGASRAALGIVVVSITFGLPACTPAKTVAPSSAQSITAEDEAQAAVLLDARSSLDEKRTIEAIALLDSVIAHYERHYHSEKRRVYCARTQTEMLFYMLTAASDRTDAIAVGQNWAAAYYLKAFALVELRKLTDGRVALERARTLSPRNSQILSELAYSYQAAGDTKKAFATYVEAEEAAEFSPEDDRVPELTRALRGQGYLLTEQGRLDESEAKYRKCLELNPNDEDAKRELKYIATLRRPRGAGGGP